MIHKATNTATQIMALWYHYDNLRTKCQFALFFGAVFMFSSLCCAVGAYARQVNWLDNTQVLERPVHLYATALVLALLGLWMGWLYNRWLPRRQLALQRYQQVASLDVW
ncbi:hypothetical protein [Xanthomonas phage RTH11]|nr:hypothetical protein [Xanthomonas phage RTH11]